MNSPTTAAPAAPVNSVSGFFANLLSSAESFFNNDVWPFLKNLFSNVLENEITALAPLAEEAVTEIGGDVLGAISNPGGFVKALNATVAILWEKAQTLAVPVAETSIVTSAHAALTNYVAANTPAQPAA
jgi:hypothetical protein